jgi:O-antigen/teichoic acid export membrane protein
MIHRVMPSRTDTKPQDKTPLTHIVVRNTFFNLLTQALLVVAAIWSLPLIVKGLSSEGFGLLSLVWAFIGYFTLLDFGISRANTKFLSEALAKADAGGMRKLVWTSLSISFLLGTVSGGAMILAARFLVEDLFKINAAMSGEAIRAFTYAGIGIPFMLVFGTLKGFQMALQRFGIVNLFQGLTGIIQWVGSVALLWWGYGLEEVVILTVGLRVILALIAFGILPLLIPGIYRGVQFWDGPTLKKLLSFGGWVTISQVISPLFLYLDRVFIGAFLTLAAVAYYSVPQEALTRVLVVPMSLTTTLFPAMSEQSVLSLEESRVGVMYYRSTKYLFMVMFPLVLIFLVCAPEIVNLWLGKEIAGHTVLIFRILAVGLLFNALAQIPTTALHAFGRPDITAKFHMLELPVMVILNLILIPWIGIVGAAIAWTLRVVIDTILLFSAVQRRMGRSFLKSDENLMRRRSSLHPIVILVSASSIMLVGSSSGKIIAGSIFVVVCVASTWLFGFDDVDRKFFMQLRSKMFGPAGT